MMSDPTMVPCEQAGCEEVIAATDLHRCVACGGYFCERHLTFGTWHDGDAANRCLDCYGDDAEDPPR